MIIDARGWCKDAVCRPSPHFNLRPAPLDVRLVVIHNISLPAGQFGTGFVDSLFLGSLDSRLHPTFSELQGLRVSSHFYIDRQGQLFQYVSCQDRAWHAGISSFQGIDNCNDYSVGIELEGSDFVDFEDAQYEKLSDLCGSICKKYPIEAIVGHSDVAPGRKTDPGSHFEWSRLISNLSVGHPLIFPIQAADPD